MVKPFIGVLLCSYLLKSFSMVDSTLPIFIKPVNQVRNVGWQEILAADECKTLENHRQFSVFRSENGLSIVPGWGLLEKDDTKKKDEVLYVDCYTGDIAYIPTIQFEVRPGQAGKHLLTDPEDHKPLNRVEIKCQYGGVLDETFKSVKIQTIRLSEGDAYDCKASYTFEKDTLTVSNGLRAIWGIRHYGVMTDEYAVHLIDTINKLIPDSTNPTQQQERRARQETQTPKALPPARRTRPPGR